MNPVKIKVRTNIRFMVKFGCKTEDIISALCKVCGDNPRQSAIYKWITCYKEERDRVEEDKWIGRLSTSLWEEKIWCYSRFNWRWRTIISRNNNTLDISKWFSTMLSEKLKLSKISDLWLPKLLWPDQQHSFEWKF